MVVNTFKMEKIDKSVSLVHNVTLLEARFLFYNRMLGPKGVQPIPCDKELYVGIAVSKKEPLGEFLKNGVIHISAESKGENRQFILPEDVFVKAADFLGEKGILKRENTILLITGGYTIEQNGNLHTIVFARMEAENLRSNMQIFTRPEKGGSKKTIDGMPVGDFIKDGESDAMNCVFSSDFGSVIRNTYDYYGAGGGPSVSKGRQIAIGETFSERRNILAQEGPDFRKLIKAAEQEFGEKLGPAAKKLFETIKDMPKDWLR